MNLKLEDLLGSEEFQARVKQYIIEHPELISSAIKRVVSQRISELVGKAFDTWTQRGKENQKLIDTAVDNAFKKALEEIKPDMSLVKAAVDRAFKKTLRSIRISVERND